MKSIFYIISFFLLFNTSCKKEATNNLPLHNKRVLILGNSITQNGGYVDFMEYYLRKHYPNQQLDIISIGLSGETISGTSEAGREFPRSDVHNRLDNALNEIKPDVVLACYGMNDGNYQPLDSLRFQAYKDGILKLKSKIEARNAKLILITPTVFDPDPIAHRVSKENEPHSYWHSYYKYNEVLTAYSNWLLSLENDSLKVIDLHHNLNAVLTEMKQLKADSTFIPDGVHPNKIGHFYMAKKLLKDLYPDVLIENPTKEIEFLQSDSLYTVVSKRRALQSEGWRNYIGFTKNGKSVKTDAISTTKNEVKKLDKNISQLQTK